MAVSTSVAAKQDTRRKRGTFFIPNDMYIMVVEEKKIDISASLQHEMSE